LHDSPEGSICTGIPYAEAMYLTWSTRLLCNFFLHERLRREACPILAELRRSVWH